MNLPFSIEQFLAVFSRYNEGIWPLQLAFYALAGLGIFMVARAPAATGRWINLLLAGLWAWMGVVYHWGYFTEINQAAYLFGGLFLLQALVFAAAAFRQQPGYRLRMDGAGLVGTTLIAYALVIYPVFGAWVGPVYPRAALFGLPCPTTIFTFGVLLWAEDRVPWRMVLIPAVWSLIGFSAAIDLGMLEDYGLVVAGFLGTVIIAWKNRQLPRIKRTEAGTAAV